MMTFTQNMLACRKCFSPLKLSDFHKVIHKLFWIVQQTWDRRHRKVSFCFLGVAPGFFLTVRFCIRSDNKGALCQSRSDVCGVSVSIASSQSLESLSSLLLLLVLAIMLLVPAFLWCLLCKALVMPTLCLMLTLADYAHNCARVIGAALVPIHYKLIIQRPK